MFIIVLMFMCSFVHVFLCMSMPMCCSCFMRVFMLGCLSVYAKNLYVCLFSLKAEVESGHTVGKTSRLCVTSSTLWLLGDKIQKNGTWQ